MTESRKKKLWLLGDARSKVVQILFSVSIHHTIAEAFTNSQATVSFLVDIVVSTCSVPGPQANALLTHRRVGAGRLGLRSLKSLRPLRSGALGEV